MKFSIKDSFSKCDQIRRKLLIWSHLLKKPLMENFIFCVVLNPTNALWKDLMLYRLNLILNPNQGLQPWTKYLRQTVVFM